LLQISLLLLNGNRKMVDLEGKRREKRREKRKEKKEKR